MIIRNKEKDHREEEAYCPEALDFRSVEADAPSLEALEAGSVDLLVMLRQQRDDENAQFTIPERTFVEGEPEEVSTNQQVNKSTKPTKLPRRGMSPWWLAAAVMVGFVVGFAMPHTSDKAAHNSAATFIADTLHGRSLATGDVNMALLVSM